MTERHTINKIIDDILERNRKIKDSRYKFKIPICVCENCYEIRLTDLKGRLVGKDDSFWTSNYSHGKLTNSNYNYAELTGTICLEHLSQKFMRKK